MKMTSLKLSKQEAKTEFGMDSGSTPAKDANLPRYPYGTKIQLETEALDKLGISPTDYEVGQVLTVTARVEVCRTTEEERQGKSRCELDLQITDISLIEDKKAKKEKIEGEHLNKIAAPTNAPSYDE